MRKGKTFIICGPSGVGKGTVVARLLASDPSLYFSVSATTRAPRHGEVDGVAGNNNFHNHSNSSCTMKFKV